MPEDKLCEFLDQALNKYDKIFLIEYGEKTEADLIERFCEYFTSHQAGKRWLVLSDREIVIDGHPVCQTISHKDLEEIKKLYHMYQFSDKFCMPFHTGPVGTIWNYVTFGILSMEEAFAAILYER